MKLHRLILVTACVLFVYNVYAQKTSSSIAVHFEFDKSDINAADLAAVKNFKASHPNIEAVIIDAYADTTGTDNYNYALSERRLNALRKALNYDETKTEVAFRISAHGEKDLLFKTNPENRVAIVAVDDKRVAEIRAQRQQEVTPAPAKEAPHVDSVIKEQDAPKSAAEVKNYKQIEAVPSKPKTVGDDATGLLKLLQDAKVGESIVLTDIHFEEGRHVFLKSSKPSLNAMLSALKTMATLQLEIQGHMCCDDMLAIDGLDIDTKEFQLSYNRAKAVYDFMVQNGIDASRLSFKGFGARRRIVYPEKTDEDREKNRRVEFLIVKK